VNRGVIILLLCMLTILAACTTPAHQPAINITCNDNLTNCTISGLGDTTMQITKNTTNSTTPSSSLDSPFSKTFTEGELIRLRTDLASDPDGDEITYSFSRPFNDKGIWQTAVGDAGTYEITISATDGKLTTIRKVLIAIKEKYQPISITNVFDISVNEGETISLRPRVSSPNGENVTITYNGFMNSAEYQTTFNDAGTHKVYVLANDGKITEEKTITITVLDVNREPELSGVRDITVTEGDLISYNAVVTDADNDDVTITFSKPLTDEGKWQTSTGDAGKYDITVDANDGKSTTTKNILITVVEKNTNPVISDFEDITSSETEEVVLNPTLTDAEGDSLEVVYENTLFKGTSYTSQYGDAGVYNITLTATDGKGSVSKTIELTINRKNRAPTFIEGDLFE
jgi:PKD repeat protein